MVFIMDTIPNAVWTGAAGNRTFEATSPSLASLGNSYFAHGETAVNSLQLPNKRERFDCWRKILPSPLEFAVSEEDIARDFISTFGAV